MCPLGGRGCGGSKAAPAGTQGDGGVREGGTLVVLCRSTRRPGVSVGAGACRGAASMGQDGGAALEAAWGRASRMRGSGCSPGFVHGAEHFGGWQLPRADGCCKDFDPEVPSCGGLEVQPVLYGAHPDPGAARATCRVIRVVGAPGGPGHGRDGLQLTPQGMRVLERHPGGQQCPLSAGSLALPAAFSGPPDPLHGNSLYQKVRAAAQVSRDSGRL